MPLAALAFLSYAAGLALGFGGAFVWASAALFAVGAAALAARRHPWPLLALTAIAGAWAANAAARADAQCLERLRSQRRLELTLLTPLSLGRTARAEYAERSCRVSARIRGARGVFETGTVVAVDGIIARSGDALDVRATHVTRIRPPDALARWRHVVALRIDALFGPDAPLARALLLADMNDVDRALRDRFADAGIVHMLSVSGLHVAIVANALRALVLALGASMVTAESIALGTAIVFVGFIGAPPPAVRSVVMLVLIAVGRRAQRPTAVWGVWGVSSAASLVDPRVILDLGWQLSVTGMAGLLASAPLSKRWCAPLRGWRRTIAEGVLATTVASLATAPLVAWVFGRVSLVALATNLLAAPLFEVAQPLLFAAVVASPVSFIARLLADAARSSLWFIDLVARAGAAVPMGVVAVQPSLPTTILLAISATALVVAAAGRWPRRPLLVALGALAAACWWPAIMHGNGRLELHMLDVGQGDAIALRTPLGRWVIVDAGGAWNGGDAAKSVVLPYLRQRGGEIVLLATSHPHADHIGGAPRLLRSEHVGAVWDGGYVAPSTFYHDVLDAARSEHTPWRHVSVGDSVSIDGVSFVVLAPDSTWMQSLRDPNAASLILRVSFGSAAFLLTGDAEAGEEEWVLQHQRERLDADVLKVGHHGSATSSTEPFLEAVHPRVALVSVGASNTYGHPSADVLRRIEAQGAHVLRTDDEGTIVVSTDGVTLLVKANGAKWQYSAAH